MNCDEALGLMDAYIDGELDVATTIKVESHTASCAACKRAFADRRAVRNAVRTNAAQLYHHAPSQFEQSVLRSIRAESRRSLPRHAPILIGSGVSLACAAVCVLVFALPGMRNRTRRNVALDTVSEQLVSDHTRSLMVGHLTDVTSSDRHTVRPWFSGRLDYSPPVPDLASQGYPLRGGRLDELSNRPVSALVYGHGKHVINLFVWPAAPNAPTGESMTTVRGYNLITWTNADLTYAAISDASPPEVGTFVSLYQRAVQAATQLGR